MNWVCTFHLVYLSLKNTSIKGMLTKLLFSILTTYVGSTLTCLLYKKELIYIELNKRRRLASPQLHCKLSLDCRHHFNKFPVTLKVFKDWVRFTLQNSSLINCLANVNLYLLKRIILLNKMKGLQVSFAAVTSNVSINLLYPKIARN